VDRKVINVRLFWALALANKGNDFEKLKKMMGSEDIKVLRYDVGPMKDGKQLAKAYRTWADHQENALPPCTATGEFCYCCGSESEERWNRDNGLVLEPLRKEVQVLSKEFIGEGYPNGRITVHSTIPSVNPWPNLTDFNKQAEVLQKHSPFLFEIAGPKDLFHSGRFHRESAAVVEIVAPPLLVLRLYLQQTPRNQENWIPEPRPLDYPFAHYGVIMQSLRSFVETNKSQKISDMKGKFKKGRNTLYGVFHHLAWTYDTTQHTEAQYESLLANWGEATTGRHRDAEQVETISWIKRPFFPTDAIADGALALIDLIAAVLSDFDSKYPQELVVKEEALKDFRGALKVALCESLMPAGEVPMADRMHRPTEENVQRASAEITVFAKRFSWTLTQQIRSLPRLKLICDVRDE
jgi:hypothetical protein